MRAPCRGIQNTCQQDMRSLRPAALLTGARVGKVTGVVKAAAAQQVAEYEKLQGDVHHMRSAMDTWRAWEVSGKQAIPNVLGNVHSIESFTAMDGPDTWSFEGAGQHMMSHEISEKFKKVASYLRPNNGGITVSGGEPMLQPHFVAALFMEAHALGLTTCIDTNGQGTKDHNWDIVLPHADYVLFCIKHLDPNKYEALTGLHQAPALHFAKELAERKIPWFCRYVYIPGYTDAPEDIDKLITWTKQQPTMQAIELLPYHLLGRNKWDVLKIPYPLEGVSPPSPDAVRKQVEKIKAAGLNVLCDY